MVLAAVRTRQFWILPHEHYGDQALANANGRLEKTDPVMPQVQR